MSAKKKRRRKQKNWFGFISTLGKNSTLKVMLLSTITVGLYVSILLLLSEHLIDDFKITTTVHSILGITLGLMLVIRTNTANDRWWEGRKLVGGMVNSSRNLALKLSTLLDVTDKVTRERFAHIISNYAFALKEHLREGVDFKEIEGFDKDTIDKLHRLFHIPNGIAEMLMIEINKLYKNKQIDGYQLINMDKQAESFTDIVGACERIKRSPLPIVYGTHLKLFIFVYVLTLPFGLIHELHYFTIPAVMLVFYAMAGIEIIGEEIEDPFGMDENDIPMDAICITIRNNVFEILVDNQVVTPQIEH